MDGAGLSVSRHSTVSRSLMVSFFQYQTFGTSIYSAVSKFPFCLFTGASYTFGVFLDPLEVEMGGGHSKVDLFCNNPSVFVDECLKD